MNGSTETRVGIFILVALGIFAYMGFHIGTFRFDRSRYRTYIMHFNDISGLSRKAEVKIAGVKVGWVEGIRLAPEHSAQVEANVMILRDYVLHCDAYAIVRQDGLLGPKYLEVIPGDPLLRELLEGETIKRSCKEPVSVDEIMRQFKTIAANVEDITNSLRDTLGNNQGKEQLHNVFDNLNRATERIASFAQVIDRCVGRNEENIDNFLAMGSDIRHLTEKIDKQILPVIKENVEGLSHSVGNDFSHLSQRLEKTADSFQEAAIEARQGFKSLHAVAEKIDEGKGLIGKLINEEETYRDLKVAVQGVRNYFNKVDQLEIVFDAHTETMTRPAEHYRWEDSKGYFEVRVHPNDDRFYLLQFVTSEHGFITRKERDLSYLNNRGEYVDPDAMHLTDLDKLAFVYRQRSLVYNRGQLLFGIQFGKVFQDLALRVGLFDGTAGAGVDYDIPFTSERFRWVTTFEIFDMTGWNRKNDRRPHLKWLNRIFMFRNIYLTFGADDFVSKHNANAFFGIGMRFGDDDLKYLLGALGGVSSMPIGNGSYDVVQVV